jgi:ATP-dependent helicase/nuclease subunit A
MYVSHDLPLPDMNALTSEQERAVARRRGGLLLAAGAGSGKTAVLVERYVRAVLEDGIPPARILAITFTDRAAGELTERLRQRLLALSARAAARDLEAALVGTFHSFCARLLRMHALGAHVAPDYNVLDEAGAQRLREAAFEDVLRALAGREGDQGVEVLAAYGVSRLQEIVLGAHAELRSRGQRTPCLPAVDARGSEGRVNGGGTREGGATEGGTTESGTTEGGTAEHSIERQAVGVRALLDDLLRDFAARYEKLKAARGVLDFDDLELRACQLLCEHEQIRSSWRERVLLLMVDELQDVNPRQLAILRALERDNLFTVGDELQAIYGFRHADVGLFRERRAELAARGSTLELTRNFRARPQLLRAINAIFAPRFGERYVPLRPGASTAARGPGDDEPALELLLSDRDWEHDARIAQATGHLREAPAWRRAEARMVAQRISDLVATGRARARDVVVLLRAMTGCEAYAQALEEMGIPTLAAAGGFWEQPEIRDLVCYLRVLANPLDELALYGALASPLVGLSSDGLAQIAQLAEQAGASAWEAARTLAADQGGTLAAADRRRLADFRAWFEQERRESAWRGVAEALRRGIEASGYERHAARLPSGEARVGNIRKLTRVARRFDREEGGDVRGFLQYVTNLEQSFGRREPHAPMPDPELDAVRLMTIHAAKGLEFPVVCVAELGARPNLRTPDLLLDRDRVGLRLARLRSGDSVPALEFEGLGAERREAQADEEDRILYVAMTRARELLLLSGAASFKRWPQPKPNGAPLDWVAPALLADLPQRAATARELTSGPADSASIEAGQEAHGAGVAVRCWLNTPSTLGLVLREDSLRPNRVHFVRSALGGASARGGERTLFNASTGAGIRRGAAHSATPTPPALSYTALSELERCGYRYYLERVLGLPEAHAGSLTARDDPQRAGERLLEQVAGERPARAWGELLHRVLHSYEFPTQPPVSGEQIADLAHELGMTLHAGECERIVELLLELSGTALAARLASGTVLRELPFAFTLGEQEPMITGVIDALLKHAETGYLVVDYKSDRVRAGEELEALVRERYGSQRLIYALAALHDGANEVEVVHWFVHRPCEWVSATFDAAQRISLEQELRERVRRAGERGHAVSERPDRELCCGCPARGTLCSWAEAETWRSPARS